MWLGEQIELLTRLWNEGHSASKIAERIPGKTRNAVLGMRWRLDLRSRQTAYQSRPINKRYLNRPEKVPATVPRAGKGRREAKAVRPVLSSLPPKSYFPIDLGSGCRWPIGHPGEADFHFCGEKRCRHGWGSYCEKHYDEAYVPLQRKREAAHGVPARVAKLRAAGNAIVPQVAAEFVKAAMTDA